MWKPTDWFELIRTAIGINLFSKREPKKLFKIGVCGFFLQILLNVCAYLSMHIPTTLVRQGENVRGAGMLILSFYTLVFPIVLFTGIIFQRYCKFQMDLGLRRIHRFLGGYGKLNSIIQKSVLRTTISSLLLTFSVVIYQFAYAHESIAQKMGITYCSWYLNVLSIVPAAEVYFHLLDLKLCYKSFNAMVTRIKIAK